jgi:hypothetical protein
MADVVSGCQSRAFFCHCRLTWRISSGVLHRALAEISLGLSRSCSEIFRDRQHQLRDEPGGLPKSSASALLTVTAASTSVSRKACGDRFSAMSFLSVPLRGFGLNTLRSSDAPPLTFRRISSHVNAVNAIEPPALAGISVEKIDLRPHVNLDPAIAQILATTNSTGALLSPCIEPQIMRPVWGKSGPLAASLNKRWPPIASIKEERTRKRITESRFSGDLQWGREQKRSIFPNSDLKPCELVL